jgi:CspA family cold shock protein
MDLFPGLHERGREGSVGRGLPSPQPVESTKTCFWRPKRASRALLRSHKTVFGALRLLLPSLRFPGTPGAPIPARPPERKNDMPIGTVKFFNASKGYGFIAPEGGGNDAFVHISAVERAGMSTLNQDQRVSYELETDQRGKTSAVNLASA